MSSSEIVVRVNGWDLVSESGKVEEARIKDLELATKLAYSRLRDIRKLIKKLIDGGYLPGIQTRATKERIERQGRGIIEITVDEYYLTEAEALLVISKSETSVATAIMKEVIDVYIAVRRGLLSNSDPAAIIAAVRESITCELGGMREETRLLKERLISLDRHPNGLLGDTDAKELRRQITVVATMRRQLGEAGAPLSIYRRVDDQIRREVGYPNEKGAKWELCAASLGAPAFSRVGMMFHALSGDLRKQEVLTKKAKAEKQVEMFRAAVEG